jgi:hypothetical protein
MPQPDVSMLEHRLVELGRHAEWPQTPDVWPAVAARIAQPAPTSAASPKPRLWRAHPAFAVALVALLVAAIAVAATPPARSALLRWLGIEGVAVKDVPRVRPASPSGVVTARLGRSVSLAQARRIAGFRVLTAPLPGPGDVRVLSQPGGRAITLVYGRPGPLLLTQFRGTATPFILKLAGPGTHLRRTSVAGHPAYWLTGAHDVIYRYARGDVYFEKTALVAANVLIWEQGAISYRMETRLPFARALAVARGLR